MAVSRSDLLTLDYVSDGQPAAFVRAVGATDSTLDDVSDGQPFYATGGDSSEINSGSFFFVA